MTQQNRQLAAITFIDIVGFSKLMHEDEEKAIHLLSLQKDVVYPIIESHNGKILKELGDGLLISFSSAIQAVKCTLEIQAKIEYIENLNYRIGVHVGDVIIEGSDVFGDGVNIASRIQNIPDSGEICISRSVYEAIQNQSTLQCTSLGAIKLKGIAEKIELFILEASNKSLPDPIKKKLNVDISTYKNVKKWFIGIAFSGFIAVTLINFIMNYYQGKDKISIAILPFGNTIKDEEYDYLSQQFVDEINYKLININYLSIKDISQVLMKYESNDPSRANIIDLSIAQKLGEKINANYILYGNYLIFNKEQIKITCNLSDVENGTIINAVQEIYNIVDLMEVFDVFPEKIKTLIHQSNLNKREVKNEN